MLTRVLVSPVKPVRSVDIIIDLLHYSPSSLMAVKSNLKLKLNCVDLHLILESEAEVLRTLNKNEFTS